VPWNGPAKPRGLTRANGGQELEAVRAKASSLCRAPSSLGAPPGCFVRARPTLPG
jgi:hypothetical protein